MKWTQQHSRNAVAVTFTLYCLSDNGSSGIRYFGITKDSLEERFSAHIWDAKKDTPNYKSRWLRRCMIDGNDITINPIRTNLTQELACRYERALIRFFKKAFKLTNSHSGGSRGAAPRKFKTCFRVELKDLETFETPIKIRLMRISKTRFAGSDGNQHSAAGLGRFLSTLLTQAA